MVELSLSAWMCGTIGVGRTCFPACVNMLTESVQQKKIDILIRVYLL